MQHQEPQAAMGDVEHMTNGKEDAAAVLSTQYHTATALKHNASRKVSKHLNKGTAKGAQQRHHQRNNTTGALKHNATRKVGKRIHGEAAHLTANSAHSVSGRVYEWQE